jgi:hypothetical protein
MPALARAEVETQPTGRTIYREFFCHALKDGTSVIDTEELIYRANVARNLFKGEYYIILAHPKKSSLNFIKQYLANLPLIEITIKDRIGYRFAGQAAWAKIQSGVPLNDYLSRSAVSDYQHPNHLHIEWSDLILDCPVETFDRIQEFVGLIGNKAQFEQSVTDYCERNKDLIELAREI